MRFWEHLRVCNYGCLRLSLPRSSKSPELVQLLRDHVFQPTSWRGGLRNERKETAMVCLKYIEVSSNMSKPFYVSGL